MNTQHWQRVKELFKAVIKLPIEEQSAFLDKECGQDHGLRTDVEKLLTADSRTGDILEPLISINDSALPSGESLLNTQLGPYLLKRVISSGGMGTVYEAYQEHPRRTVAIKVLRAGIASKSTLRRFEYEAQIMASLRHPNIAQLYEAGTHGEEERNVPYFVMEYIPEARPITDYAHEEDLSIGARLHLFMQACEAVQHGHQKGIIHRDLKPGNILVDIEGHVKIIDFGIARATDSDMALTTLQTDIGQLLGTVQYMSPEQCEADPHSLDIRSDVYSLGVVLFELLCESLPYDTQNVAVFEATRRIREEQPRRPSTTNRTLRGDVETIVLKSLEKDRERRYSSAEDLRRDIDRYLKGEPITARPPTVSYRVKTFARRHKALVSGAALVFLVLVAGIITSTSLYYKATREAESSKAINAFFNKMILSLFSPTSNYRILDINDEEEMEALQSGKYAKDISIDEMLYDVVPEIEDAFKGKPLEEVRIREAIGHALLGLDHFEDAVHLLREALKICQEHLGENHVKTLVLKLRLGTALHDTGNMHESKSVLREALEGMQYILGNDHRYTLYCESKLAYGELFTGKIENAMQRFRKTLAAQQRVLGKKHRHTLDTMLLISVLFIELLRLNEVEPWVEELHLLCHEKYGKDHPLTIESDLMLGFCYIMQCKYKKAKSLLQSVVDRGLALYGGECTKTIFFMDRLSSAIMGVEKTEEAEKLYLQVLEGYRKFRGEGFYNMKNVLTNYTNFLASQGRFNDTVELQQDRLKRCLDSLGESHPQTIEASAKLATSLLNRGKVNEAQEQFLHWINLNIQAFEAGKPDVALAQLSSKSAPWQAAVTDATRLLVKEAIALGHAHIEDPMTLAQDFNAFARILLNCEPADLRDFDLGLTLAQKAVDLSQGNNAGFLTTLALAHHLKEEHEQAVLTQNKALNLSSGVQYFIRWGYEESLLNYMLSKGDTEEAKQFFSQLDANFKTEYGESDLCHGIRLYRKVWLLVNEGYYAFTEPYARRCIDLLGKGLYGKGAWGVKICHSMLGRCLSQLKRFEKAEPHLLEGYKGLKHNPLAPIKCQKEALTWIIEHYEDYGKPEKAEEWKSK